MVEDILDDFAKGGCLRGIKPSTIDQGSIESQSHVSRNTCEYIVSESGDGGQLVRENGASEHYQS